MRAYSDVAEADVQRRAAATDSTAFQAYGILLFGFTVAPIIAGADKFLGILTNWTQYLAPIFPNTLGIDPATFMMIVGAIEIVGRDHCLSKAEHRRLHRLGLAAGHHCQPASAPQLL